jgi:eukaryotic-like serine/threonine-protein kinase
VFRCMTGHLPFEGEAVGDVLVKLCTAPVPVPSQLAPDLPPGFDAWTARALAREPEGRFQSAADLSQSLAALCGLTGPVMSNVSGDAFSTVQMPSKLGPHVTPFSATTPSPALTPAPLHGTTGAPFTQTPAPLGEKPRTGTIVVAALAALVVVGIGVAVLTKVLGGGATPVAAAGQPEPAPKQAAPAQQPALTASPVLPPAAAPTAAPSAEPQAPAVPAPSAASKKPPTARPTTRPVVKQPPAGTSAPRPGTDIGF